MRARMAKEVGNKLNFGSIPLTFHILCPRLSRSPETYLVFPLVIANGVTGKTWALKSNTVNKLRDFEKITYHTEPISSSENEVNDGNLTVLLWRLSESMCIKYLNSTCNKYIYIHIRIISVIFFLSMAWLLIYTFFLKVTFLNLVLQIPPLPASVPALGCSSAETLKQRNKTQVDAEMANKYC